MHDQPLQPGLGHINFYDLGRAEIELRRSIESDHMFHAGRRTAHDGQGLCLHPPEIGCGGFVIALL